VQINEPWRYLGAPSAAPALLHKRLVYLVESKRDRSDLIRSVFSRIGLPTEMQSGRAAIYELFPVSGPKRSAIGKLP
jgi:hypothetical protein